MKTYEQLSEEFGNYSVEVVWVLEDLKEEEGDMETFYHETTGIAKIWRDEIHLFTGIAIVKNDIWLKVIDVQYQGILVEI